MIGGNAKVTTIDTSKVKGSTTPFVKYIIQCSVSQKVIEFFYHIYAPIIPIKESRDVCLKEVMTVRISHGSNWVKMCLEKK